MCRNNYTNLPDMDMLTFNNDSLSGVLRMNQRNKLLLLALSVCLCKTTTGLAAATDSEVSQEKLESAIQKVNLQTAELQKEVRELKVELRRVKQEKAKPLSTSAKTAPVEAADNNIPISHTLANVSKLNPSPVVDVSLLTGGTDLDPYVFLSTQSSMSQGLFFLKERQAMTKLLGGEPLPSATTPQVMLGGKLEGLAQQVSPYKGSDTNSFDLVTAELDTYAEVSPWASGFMSIAYNNASLNQVLLGSGNPVNNSNFVLNRGYVTIGNLDKSPVYLNAGQIYLPFGAYSNYMLSNSVTKVMGRTLTRAAELGFYKNGLNVSLFGFNGAANDSPTINKLDNWGASTNYIFTSGDFTANVGGGYLNDMSDSQGVQNTSSGAPFDGFAHSPQTEQLVHYVPAADLNMLLAKGPLYFSAEGVAATRAYDIRDMSMNGHGAQPKSGNLEVGYRFKAFGNKSIFSLDYGQTWDALPMNLPRNSYTATYNTSIWKNTIEVLEFRHDVNYASGTQSTGAGYQGPSGGGTQNSILGQIGVYF